MNGGSLPGLNQMHAVLTPLGRQRTHLREGVFLGSSAMCLRHPGQAPFPHFWKREVQCSVWTLKELGGQTSESSDRAGLKIRKSLFFIVTVAEDKLWVFGDCLGAWSQI